MSNQQKMTPKNWVIEVDNQVEKILQAKRETKVLHCRRSIYKLPACVRDLNPKAYTPQVVSFGPYHCDNQNLKPMEEHKGRALLQFLIRSGKSLQSYFNLFNEVVNDLKSAYDSLKPDLLADSNAFLRIMIEDGCFMLEILRAFKENIPGYDSNDPIFGNHGRIYVMPHIRRDMLMMENQLPMLVLHKLLSLQDKKDVDELNQLLLGFLDPNRLLENPSDCLHILDMYRKYLLYEKSEENQQKKNLPNGGGDIMPSATELHEAKDSTQKGGVDIIRSAIELDEAGITIKKSKSNCIKDIKFKGGVLSLPMIVVDDTTEPLYLNLMAFERFHVGAGNEVTSYVFFMDNIIDDARDIRLLHSKDIIQNGVGSDKAAAKLINSLSKDITLDQNSHLAEVYNKVNSYCKNRWPRYRANLCHRYFTSPWASISIVAAVFLFVLTITQTVYSVMDYHIQK